jgi:hypothetical protein
MWSLYQNKNYSYCSCNPFIDNGQMGPNDEMFECTEKSMFHTQLSSACQVHWFSKLCSWHMWPLQATSCEAFLPQKIKKKLQLEPILTKYASISSSGHLEDVYAIENCLKLWDHGKSLFTFPPQA